MQQKHYRRGLVLATIMTAWIVTILIAYYYVHKPFALANVRALAEAAAGLVGAGLTVALGAGVGTVLLSKLVLSPIERLAWAAALGLGVVSLAGLGLGAAGLLRPWLLWPLTVAGLAATARPLWRALRAAWTDPSRRPRSRFERLLASYCGLMLAVALIRALTPPSAWDGLVYHLTGPKLYLAAGQISHPLDLPYLGFPQLVELLFSWGMGLTGERAAAAIHWFYGLLTVLSLLAAGQRRWGSAAGWLAAAMLLSAESILLLAGWPYVDLALLLYTTLAFLALARSWDGSPQPRMWLVLSGAFAGLALSTKYTALAVLPALAAAFLAAHLRRQTKAGWLGLGIGVSIALAVWSPWLVKNLLLTGNPIYPFFFGGAYWDDWRAWWYDRPGTGLAYTAPWKLLTAPWDVTVWGVEGRGGYGATVGPLLLAFFPLLFLTWRRLRPARRRWLGAATAFCGVLYGFWLWGVARSALLLQSRLLFPAFGVLALLVSAAVEGLRTLPRRSLDLGWLARAALVGVLALTLVGVLLGAVQERPLAVLLGFESRADFLARRLGWHHVAVEYINQELPSDAVVLFLWEPRSYYCQADCRPDTLLDRFLHTTHLHGYDAATIAAAWRAEGITHLLLHRTGLEFILESQFDPVTMADLEVWDDLLARHLAPVESFGTAYELYRLEEVPP